MDKKATNIDTKLPAGWKWKTLGEVADYINGSAFKPEEWGQAGLPIIRIQNLNGSQNYNYFNGVCQDRYLVKNGDILISWSASLDVYKWNSGNAILNQHIFNTNIYTDKITKDFFYLLIKYSLEEIKSKVHGVGMQHITKGKFEVIPIPLPPLPEQNKIVSVLESAFSKIDKSIALVKENIEKIKQLNASVLDEVFEKLGSTNLKKLMDIADVKRGKSKHRPRNDRSLYDGKYPLVQTGDIRNCEKYLTKYSQTYNEKGLAQSKLWKKGTICLTIAANIGDVAILDFDACFPDSVLGIYSNTQNNNYLYYFLTSIKKKLDAKSSASAQKNLSVEKLTDLYIPIPTLKTQEKIVAFLDNVNYKNTKLLSYYQTKLLSLQQLKNSVLESAFKGELRKDVKETKTTKVVAMPVVNTQAEKFRKIEIIYSSIYANKQDNIKQGEMAIAKDMYLIDRIGCVPTGFQFAQHNWGAFDPEAKQLIHIKQYFEKVNYPNSKAFYYDVKDNGKLLEKIPAEIKQPIFEITNLLNQKIFAKYDAKQRPHKKELLATVLKCIEDTQSTDYDIIRTEMTNWKTPKQEFKNKTEKFTPEETKAVLGYILKEGWEKKVIK